VSSCNPTETADPFTVTLEPGTYEAEWFSIQARETRQGDRVSVDGARSAPFQTSAPDERTCRARPEEGVAQVFRVDQVNGAFTGEALTIDGGNGNDTLNGGDGVEFFIGGNGRDAVDGNRGNDTALLGNGRDSFRWDPGDGSDIVEGENGTDTLDFNGAGVDEIMSLSPDGERSLFLRNVASIRMDMNGVERLDLTALGGADSVTVNDMSGTDFRRADVDLSAPTGAADGVADIVTVKGTEQADNIHVKVAGARVVVDGLRTETVVAGAEPIDQLEVNALGGDDKVTVDPAVSALIGVGVELGSGQN
jgi:hypothetical protein